MSVPKATIDPRRIETLTESQKYSDLWQKLSSHLEWRLENLRLQNDGNLGEAETANLRGRIAEVKALLSLAKERPVIE